MSRSLLLGKTHWISVALLGLNSGQLLARKDRDAGKRKEGETGMETYGFTAAEGMPIQTADATSFRDLMKCKRDGINLLGDDLLTKWSVL